MKKVKLDVELDDGTTHHLTIGNPTMVAWDRTRTKREWPKTSEAPSLWMTFLAWHHMTAAGLIDCTFTDFETTRCVGVGDPEDADEDGGTKTRCA